MYRTVNYNNNGLFDLATRAALDTQSNSKLFTWDV